MTVSRQLVVRSERGAEFYRYPVPRTISRDALANLVERLSRAFGVAYVRRGARIVALWRRGERRGIICGRAQRVPDNTFRGRAARTSPGDPLRRTLHRAARAALRGHGCPRS